MKKTSTLEGGWNGPRVCARKTGYFAARADRKSERFCHDMALPCVNDVSADEVR
jgi:hypothetical protein